MTSELQRLAASPDRSVFVSANAGTGKTKVLIERVLRLLLHGEVPDTILCVTFTNAAAAEIKERLQVKLAQWAVIPREELTKDIKNITGHLPAQNTINVARRLFAQVIDNDSGPRVETTHSFSQSLLMRFPVEANLPPHFQLISDAQKETLLRSAFMASFSAPDKELKEALSFLVGVSDHETLLKHVKSFVLHRKLSDKAISMPLGFLPQFEAAMSEMNPHGTDIHKIKLSFTERLSGLAYRELQDACPDKMVDFISWHSCTSDQKAEQLDDLCSSFLTKEGQPSKRFVTKKIAAANPAIEDMFHRIAVCLIDYKKAMSACESERLSRALYVVGRYVATAYARSKLQQAVLDYDDLIIKAHSLLSSSDAMAWVRWKLDFGIHHILVDEAQDTNPAQWELLTQLVDEFFAMEADAENYRTLFSVGDFKQSIYSFQGANPHIFIQKGEAFSKQARLGNHIFEDVALSESFRSSKAVLETVNAVMSLDEVEGLGGAYQNHNAFFQKKFGLVELWPITKDEKATNTLPYFDVPDFVGDDQNPHLGAQSQLAETIALHIKSVIDGTADGLHGRSYQPGDILILVNRRNSIYALIRSALLRHNIPVAGADRMRLNRQIEIQDLLALGDVCLLPDDDLQLAVLLRSPLIGLDEASLETLASGRHKGQSLIASLKGYAGSACLIGEAVKQIEYYFDLATSLSPSAFFETILAKGGREAFYERLGVGVDETLKAFINQAYEFEQQGGLGLANFLSHQRNNDIEIKRDFGDSKTNEIRIMTIHGSKGLEAPVVYVPDIVKGIEPPATLISTENALYWPSNSTFMPDNVKEQKQASKMARAAEHQRLLYVAMTRASECLFLSGFEKSRQSIEGVSWDILISKGFQSLGVQPDDKGVYRYSYRGDDGQEHKVADNTKDTQQITSDIKERLSWAFVPPPQEAKPIRPLVPSDAVAQEAPEPLSNSKRQIALLEGQFQHELLDILSNHPTETRPEIAQRFVETAGARYTSLAKNRLSELAQSIISFMARDDIADLFSDDALSEFGISGIVGSRPVVGQIDRFLVRDDEVWIVDFKSGTPKSTDVPKSYILQMALYSALLGDIYPDHKISADIIWLRDASRSRITDAMMNQALIEAKIL